VVLVVLKFNYSVIIYREQCYKTDLVVIGPNGIGSDHEIWILGLWDS